MKSRRGQAEGLGEIFWLATLVIVLIVFSTLFFLWQDHRGQELYTADGRIDWEAGYLALSATQHELPSGATLKQTLSKDALTDGEKQEVAALLETLLERTNITAKQGKGRYANDRESAKASYFAIHDNTVVACAEDSHGQENTDLPCGGAIAGNPDAARLVTTRTDPLVETLLEDHGYAQGLAELEERFPGRVGLVHLGSERAVGVVVR